MAGRQWSRAGWGGVVLEVSGRHRDELNILGFGRAVSMFARVAVVRGLRVVQLGSGDGSECDTEMGDPGWLDPDGTNWAIAGGESGRGARPAHPEWFRFLRDQCREAEVAFFFKQHGAWAEVDEGWTHVVFPDGEVQTREQAGLEVGDTEHLEAAAEDSDGVLIVH